MIASLRDTAADTPLTGLFDAIVDRTGYGATFDRTEEEDLDRWANVLELRSELERSATRRRRSDRALSGAGRSRRRRR